MPFKTFTPTVLSSSDVNTYLMGQAVIVCTSGTHPASPNEGMVIYETDNDRLLIYTTATTGWRPSWGMPWGYQGSGTATGNQGTLTTTTDLTGLTTTFTAVANRRYKVSFHCSWDATTTGNVAAATLLAGAAVVSYGQVRIGAAGQQETLDIFGYFTAASGSLTVKAQGGMATGSGSVATQAATSNPAWLLVEDIGPSAAPA